MVIKVKGIIEFDPEDKTKKHKEQSAWKRVAIIKTYCDIDKYYSWFLKKRFNLELNRSLRGAHVTFISDKLERTICDEASILFNKKEIDFYIELEPRSNGQHWWLRVHCPDAENIRNVMGLCKIPYFGFHLTLGHANEKNIPHSEYILRQCIKFNLTSNDNRKPLNDHEIK